MYGLLGKSLKHSFSKEIHQQFGNDNYDIIETQDLDSFFRERNFKGINVTIPYKESVLPFLDELDDISFKTQSVNTIINRGGRLIGYNTDYYGLKSLLEYHNINPYNKNILIIGNGGAAKTVSCLFFDLGSNKITKICRNIKEKSEIDFKQFDTVLNYDIIVNTTPVGTYPNLDESLPFSIKEFTQLEVVIDLIYNPLHTLLLIEAKSMNVLAINGLYMLVMQALKANELFFEMPISPTKGLHIYQQLYLKMLNIIFVGLPLSGKSKYAKKLGFVLKKDVFDTDVSIEKSVGLSISEIFEKYGESFFRQSEFDLVTKIFFLHNLVISTGGGMILNQVLMKLLQHNGCIIYLDKDPQIIANLSIKNRPLIKQATDILLLDTIRRPIYQKFADITIQIDSRSISHLQEIEDKIYEYINH